MEKTIYIFLFLIILQIQAVFANRKDTYLQVFSGTIIDYVTLEAIRDKDGVIVSLLKEDSTLIEEKKADLYFTPKPVMMFYTVVEESGKYILKFENPHYHTLFQSIKADITDKSHMSDSVNIVDLGEIKLKRKLNHILDEVECVATKVKFYFDHDTLVYNADAFTTQHGFLLNDILQKMPGVVLKENGEIEANGRRVDALLLNGKDFFNNDRKTLLNNLPAFMVKDVKVYDKTKDSTSLIKREREFEGYVMDIKLDKKYQSTALGNAELGYGTDSRYFVKLLGMRFNQVSKQTWYAMSNNINKKEEISASGTRRTSSSARGENAWTKAGISYLYEQPQGDYYLNGNATIEYEESNVEHNGISSFIYEKEKIYNRSLSLMKNYEVTAETNHMLYFLGNTKWDFTLWPSLKYSKNNSNFNDTYGKFSQDIDDMWGEAWVDSLRSLEQSQAMALYGISASKGSAKYNSQAIRALLSFDKDVTIGNSNNPIRIHASYQYHKKETNTYSMSDNDQLLLNQHTFQNFYQNDDSHDDKEEITVNYGHAIGKNSITLTYGYNRNALHQDKGRYALHKLAGWDTQTQGKALGMLPSAEEMLNALDAGNSYAYDQEENLHNVELKYTFSHENGDKRKTFTVNVPLLIENKELHFYQQKGDTLIHRDKCKPDLDVSYSYSKRNRRNNGTNWGLRYSLKSTMPTLYNLVNFKDDYSSFYIHNGNPNLKDMTSHTWSGDFGYQNEKGYIEKIRSSFYLTRNSQAIAVKYDAVTGVTETTPDNINGNWRWSLDMDNTLFVSKNRLSSVGNEMNISVNNNVDYAYANLSSTCEKRTVLNFQVTEKIRFNWRSDNTRIHAGGNAYVTYRKSTSEWEDFSTLEMFDYGVLGDVSFELPKDWRLKSDLLTVCRSGYSTVNMNDQEYIWSADLTKSLSERYSFSLECYDILNQRKNVYHYVNAQGCRTTFYNNLQRYVMLRFTIRLNKGEQQHRHVH